MTVAKKIYFSLIVGVFFLTASLLMTSTSYAFNIDSQINEITHTTTGLRPKVLRLALEAYYKAHHIQHLDQKQILTVVDYSLPSDQKRLWVIDLKQDRVIKNMLVAHGSGSGVRTPTRFSNTVNSHESSLGLMRTGPTYYGHHGYSMRIVGLEPGFNTNVLKRDVVVHGSDYVNTRFAKAYDRVGRSWGCLAVDKHKVKDLIHDIKGGTLIFAYYPDNNYLENSDYLP